MPTKSYTLISYHLQDSNIQSQRKSLFATTQGGQQFFGVQKDHFLK
jgi:hypothetical protein